VFFYCCQCVFFVFDDASIDLAFTGERFFERVSWENEGFVLCVVEEVCERVFSVKIVAVEYGEAFRNRVFCCEYCVDGSKRLFCPGGCALEDVRDWRFFVGVSELLFEGLVRVFADDEDEVRESCA